MFPSPPLTSRTPRALLLAALALTSAVPGAATGAAVPLPVPMSIPAAEAPGVGAGWSAPAAPVTPSAVLRRFEPPIAPWSAGHRGVDWAAPSGEVLSPGVGSIRFAGDVAGRGVVTIAHPNGMLSSLEPVDLDERLAVGDRVVSGQSLGTVSGAASGAASGPAPGSAAGRTSGAGTSTEPAGGPGEDAGGATASPAHCTVPCVHWGVRIPGGWIVDGSAWDRYLDPLALLGWSGPSVLWPVSSAPPERTGAP